MIWKKVILDIVTFLSIWTNFCYVLAHKDVQEYCDKVFIIILLVNVILLIESKLFSPLFMFIGAKLLLIFSTFLYYYFWYIVDSYNNFLRKVVDLIGFSSALKLWKIFHAFWFLLLINYWFS